MPVKIWAENSHLVIFVGWHCVPSNIFVRWWTNSELSQSLVKALSPSFVSENLKSYISFLPQKGLPVVLLAFVIVSALLIAVGKLKTKKNASDRSVS